MKGYTVVNKRLKGTYSDKSLSSKIEGYQVGRHVVFYRELRNHQIWTGWISDDTHSHSPTPTLSGTFSHRGGNSFPWHGYLVVDDDNKSLERDSQDANAFRGR